MDKNGLRNLTVESVARAMQSKPGSELAGIEGRTRLLTQLGEALDQQKDFFGDDGSFGGQQTVFWWINEYVQHCKANKIEIEPKLFY